MPTEHYTFCREVNRPPVIITSTPSHEYTPFYNMYLNAQRCPAIEWYTPYCDFVYERTLRGHDLPEWLWVCDETSLPDHFSEDQTEAPEYYSRFTFLAAYLEYTEAPSHPEYESLYAPLYDNEGEFVQFYRKTFPCIDYISYTVHLSDLTEPEYTSIKELYGYNEEL